MTTIISVKETNYTVMVKRELQRPKYYTPSVVVTSYLAEKLQFERLELNKTRAGIELSNDEKIERKRLATDKSRFLDTIFQEMADLTYFFESIATHKELQEIFDRDLVELFGLRMEQQTSTDTRDQKKYPIFFEPKAFERLMSAMLGISNKNDNSFRISLPYILQSAIYSKLANQQALNDSKEIAEIMLSDIGRGIAWTKSFSKEPSETDFAYHRALGYTPFHISILRSYKEEYDHYGRIL